MAFIRNGGVYVWVHTSNVQYTYTTVGEYVENGKHIYNHAFIEQHCNSAKNTSLSAINDAKQSIYVGKTIYASDGQKLERILNLFINHNHMRPDIGGTYGIFTCWHLSFGNKYGVGNVNIGARAGSPISSVTANAGLNNSVNRINTQLGHCLVKHVKYGVVATTGTPTHCYVILKVFGIVCLICHDYLPSIILVTPSSISFTRNGCP